MSLTKATYAMIEGAPANVLDYGADPTGVSDSYAAFVAALNTGRAVYVPGGTYILSATLNFPPGNPNTRKFFGDGFQETVLLFDDVSGISTNNTGAKFSDFSIGTTQLGLYPPNPQRSDINPATVGFRIFGSHMVLDHVQIIGFGIGIRIDTKFYNTLRDCRVQYNLVGLKNESNFNHSYGCYYNEMFDKSVWVELGTHDFRSCSLEGVFSYDNDNANYPNGGALIGPETLTYPLPTTVRIQASFTDCYSETHNFYANQPLLINTLYGGASVRVIAQAPSTVKGMFANWSVNLAEQPTAGNWTTVAGITQTNNAAQIDGSRYYTIFTSTVGPALLKAINSPLNTSVRGVTIPTTPTADYLIYAGVWVNIQTANFETAYPELRVQFEDIDGNFFYAEAVRRTQLPIDNTLVDEWQYIGFATGVRPTLSTGRPLAAARLEIRIGDGDASHTGNARILWVANPELRMLFGDNGQAFVS
jgi:hypothetical protein